MFRAATPDFNRDGDLFIGPIRELQTKNDRHDEAADIGELHHIIVLVFLNGAEEGGTFPVLKAIKPFGVFVPLFVRDGVDVVFIVEVTHIREAFDPRHDTLFFVETRSDALRLVGLFLTATCEVDVRVLGVEA